MQKVLPYAVVKRLPRHFFKDVNKGITVDWEQPVEVIELNKVLSVYSKVNKALEGKDLTGKKVVLIYPTSNIDFVRRHKQYNMSEYSKIRLEFKSACFKYEYPREYNIDKLTVANIPCSIFRGHITQIQDELRTQNKFNKMYLLIINKADKKGYVETYERDVFHGLERVHGEVSYDLYRGLNGQKEHMSFSTGYIASKSAPKDEWNFATLEKCMDKSGYRNHPFTIQRRLDKYKRSKFTKEIGLGNPQALIRLKIQEVLERMETLTVDYCQQVKLNYVRDSKTFTNKLSKLTDIVKCYEELIQKLADQVHNVNKYYFMNRNEFDEKMAQLQQSTDEALGQLEVA